MDNLWIWFDGKLDNLVARKQLQKKRKQQNVSFCEMISAGRFFVDTLQSQFTHDTPESRDYAGEREKSEELIWRARAFSYPNSTDRDVTIYF